jgi:dTDP-4-amino-4,6-dideoxygalactose transaminase
MDTLALHGGPKVRTNPYPPWPVFDEAEENALIAVLKSREWGTFGPEVRRFEKKFAAYLGTDHALSVCNGTVSLEIILRALGIGDGDEVVIPPYTFAATMTAVLMAGATPIFADIDPETCNIDPESVEIVLTENTKAIIVVHMAGLPVDMDRLGDIASKNGLSLIEDAAQAHGSEWQGRKAGAIGTCGSFSFQLSKNMSSGEGGAIVTNDGALIDRCWSVHNCGRIKNDLWYMHHYLSGNYRITDFQGAILNVQLDRLEEQISVRERNAALLEEKLKRVQGISTTVRDLRVTRHTHHLFIFMFDEKQFNGIGRTRFVEALNAEGIPAVVGYTPLYRQPIFRDKAVARFIKDPEGYADLFLPGTEKTVKEAIWLTQNVLLGNEADLEDIVQAIEKVQKHSAELD